MKIRTSLNYNTAPACYKSSKYLFVGGAYDMWTHNGNCTHYAYARMCELAGKNVLYDMANSFPDAGLWLNVTKWETGATPKPGAVGVCDNHVFVVEEVYSDGSYLVSEGSWKTFIFRTIKKSTKKGQYYDNVAGKLKAFIYNPYVNDDSPTVITTDQAITKMAQDVIQGMYGNGEDRKNNLYRTIQNKVNQINK